MSATPLYAWCVGNGYLQPGAENVLEWVLFAALASSGLCVLSLATMMIISKWRMYVKQRTRHRDCFRFR